MSHISTFVSRRFEELHALLNASGYLLDFSGSSARLRHEFDPDGHPESPYHLHPPGAPDHVRQPAQATTPETVLSDLSALIATERAARRL